MKNGNMRLNFEEVVFLWMMAIMAVVLIVGVLYVAGHVIVWLYP